MLIRLMLPLCNPRQMISQHMNWMKGYLVGNLSGYARHIHLSETYIPCNIGSLLALFWHASAYRVATISKYTWVTPSTRVLSTGYTQSMCWCPTVGCILPPSRLDGDDMILYDTTRKWVPYAYILAWARSWRGGGGSLWCWVFHQQLV